MPRQNVPFLSFNRGLIDAKTLARVDLDRTRLSAEVMRNWLARTQGALTIRPGTKYMGSSLNDTGAAWVEFVAATDDVALLELAGDTGTGAGAMRIWLGSDPHNLALLERPSVSTSLSLSDTGWVDTSTGGALVVDAEDVIPRMSGPTSGPVTISASSSNSELIFGFIPTGQAWHAADDDDIFGTYWTDTGDGGSTLPSWWNVDFGSANAEAIHSYSIRAGFQSSKLDNAPNSWELLAGNHDTGSYATDTGKWTLVDARSGQTGWAVSEIRTFTRPDSDTGTVEGNRHYRLYFTAVDGDTELLIDEIEMFRESSASQVTLGNKGVLNATSIGARARAEKEVVVSSADTGVEHSLALEVDRGPITLRVGSSQRDDDYIRETDLGSGFHNLAFTPTGNFWVTLQTNEPVSRIINSLAIGDTGTVSIQTPWVSANLDDIRYDQSADIVYLDCRGVAPRKIERRGIGRSWSVVKFEPRNGPFLSGRTTSAKLSVSHFYGNTSLNSDIPYFQSGHVGALVRIFHENQSGEWALGALDAKTDAVAVTGISDTGTTPPSDGTSDRSITIAASGTWSGSVIVERSVEGPDVGFKQVSSSILSDADATDTGTFSHTFIDRDDNIKVWYRVRIADYTSGVAVVSISYRAGGGVTGIGRITAYNSNTDVDIEVLSRFSDTGPSDNWQEGSWSAARGFPTALALHSGRLFHAQGGSLFGSVSDDFENFDDTIIGDAAPIIRTLGSGPVDNIYFLLSLVRMVIGTAGAEFSLQSSSIEEPVTADNSAARAFSTIGSANLRALKIDSSGIYVQRSQQNVYKAGFGARAQTIGDYEGQDLTLLVPDLLTAGIVSLAIQRRPDTRIHCVLADGTVGILTYEPVEEVICWQTWATDGSVEKVSVLPGTVEDAVYYHINRTVNGVTKRFLEKWAKESECLGDTGLCFIMDCASSFTDTGRTNTLTDIAAHLPNANVVLWGDLDTGSQPFIDLSTDTGSNGSQKLYTVDTGGDITLSLTEGLHHAVAGLPYSAAWKSAKMAYGAQFGTALTMKKRVPQIGLVLYKTHNRGLYTGSDTGEASVQPLPRTLDKGAVVDPDKIYRTLDNVPFATPGGWDEDSRVTLRGKAPRPATVLAIVSTVETNEK